tara:strand:- start:223 stop:594 length:372 start_codon:yes stop_codon:yes gene_type:complete
VKKSIKKVISYFGETYRLSPVIFYAELIELVLLVGASIVLTVTVLDPATQWFIPLYLVGSIFGLTSAILRRAGLCNTALRLVYYDEYNIISETCIRCCTISILESFTYEQEIRLVGQKQQENK